MSSLSPSTCPLAWLSDKCAQRRTLYIIHVRGHHTCSAARRHLQFGHDVRLRPIKYGLPFFDAVLFADEPFAFTQAHIDAFAAEHPAARPALRPIDGSMTQWYGSRAVRGLDLPGGVRGWAERMTARAGDSATLLLFPGADQPIEEPPVRQTMLFFAVGYAGAAAVAVAYFALVLAP